MIVDLIRETCREEKIALLMVTHSMEVAGQFDRVDRLEDINRLIGKSAASTGSDPHSTTGGSRP